MNELRNQFHRELTDLKKLIGFYDSEIKLLGDFAFQDANENNELLRELSSKLKAFSISKRQYNYNSIIISLYGAFERFIENVLITYIDRINKIVEQYDKLPEAIIKNHFTLSLTLLNRIDQPRYTGPLNKNEVIHNLHSCINLNSGYQLNKDAFAQHTANFRAQVIDESFAHIGIQSISTSIMKEDRFRKYIIFRSEKTEEDSIGPEESFQLLNDLAERRNDVAHGVASEILQNEILLEYIEYFEVYTEALAEVLNAAILGNEAHHAAIQIGEITDVFQDGYVICAFTSKRPMKVGDFLIGKNASKIIKAKILNLKLDDRDIDSCDDQLDYEIGIRIDKPFKKNFKVYWVVVERES